MSGEPSGGRFRTVVAFDVRIEVAFDYLADPRNRPQWQSSLLSIKMDDPRSFDEPTVGTTWVDSTIGGVRPRMEITECDPPTRWAEVGHWAGITGRLLLEFAPAGRSCIVTATGSVEGTGWWRFPARAASTVAGAAIGSDLRRAGRVLSQRPPSG